MSSGEHEDVQVRRSGHQTQLSVKAVSQSQHPYYQPEVDFQVAGRDDAATPRATTIPPEPPADVETAVPAPPPSSPASGIPVSRETPSSNGDPDSRGGVGEIGYHMETSGFLLDQTVPRSEPQSAFASPTNKLGESLDRSNRRRSTRRDETFKKRLIQHSQKDMLFELNADGTYDMKEMTVREVFNYVQEIVAPYSLESCVSPVTNTESDATGRRGGHGIQRMQSMGLTGALRMRPSASNAAGMAMSSLNLHQRDMRQLFSSQSKTEPAFSVRRNCILINFETLRGIVLVDRLLLVVDSGADSILMDVRKAILESTEDVYEFELKAVEALLSVSSERLGKEIKEVEGPVGKIVNILEGHHGRATSAENTDRFRVLSNKISVLENRAKARRRALLMVLENDTDLAMMNLTRMFQSPEDYVPPLSTEVLEDHEEMELLLEAYLQDINSIYNVLELLQARVRSTEALVMVKLDIARNRILTAGLVFSMASTCFTLGTLVSGLFGMNLNSGLENTTHLFTWVAAGTVCSCVVAFCGVFTFFYRHGILVS